MSLSRWMRDYLYISLGGNRVSTKRLYMNLWIVFLISGFWHGAEWTFIIWGAYHGFFLVAERLFIHKLLVFAPKALRISYSFLVVVIGWVFFRANDLTHAMTFLHTMFIVDLSSFYFCIDYRILFFLSLSAMSCFIAGFSVVEKLEQEIFVFKNTRLALISYTFIGLLLSIVSLGYITSGSFNPFIYFRF
jgi:alginate O-acetyltransferase complex protein AlgI